MPYSKSKFFKVHISSKNLLKAIRDANHGLSEDLSKYRLTIAGILFELPNYVLNGHNTSNVNVSKFSVYVQQE
jgi:phage tail protein X